MQIVNLDTVSYLHHTSENYLETADKEKKDKYIHLCLKRRCSFTEMLYSADIIPGTDAVEANIHLLLLLFSVTGPYAMPKL